MVAWSLVGACEAGVAAEAAAIACSFAKDVVVTFTAGCAEADRLACTDGGCVEANVCSSDDEFMSVAAVPPSSPRPSSPSNSIVLSWWCRDALEGPTVAAASEVVCGAGGSSSSGVDLSALRREAGTVEVCTCQGGEVVVGVQTAGVETHDASDGVASASAGGSWDRWADGACSPSVDEEHLDGRLSASPTHVGAAAPAPTCWCGEEEDGGDGAASAALPCVASFSPSLCKKTSS